MSAHIAAPDEAIRPARSPDDAGPETISLASEVPVAAAAPPSCLGRCVGGRYQVVQLLAQGGMSRLYGAFDRQRADELVAIKELQALGTPAVDRWTLITAFMREANILGDLHHPHIVRALDFIEEQDGYYIIMEWLGGQNLHSQLEMTPGGLPEAQVLGWARQLCSALRYVHGHRPPIIFCDLKPSNVFLLNSQQVKLVDFGIARYYFPEADNASPRFGTPGFAAPEQYRAGRISPATDVFGLGRTLHCLLTGFDPTGHSAAAAAFDFPPVQRLRPEISARTSRALEQALAVEVALRFASIDALERALGLEPSE
jgi:eukaryotic-like serine/threonine-protein kinase